MTIKYRRYRYSLLQCYLAYSHSKMLKKSLSVFVFDFGDQTASPVLSTTSMWWHSVLIMQKHSVRIECSVRNDDRLPWHNLKDDACTAAAMTAWSSAAHSVLMRCSRSSRSVMRVLYIFSCSRPMLHTPKWIKFKSGEFGGHSNGEMNSSVSLSRNFMVAHSDHTKLTSSFRNFMQVVKVLFL